MQKQITDIIQKAFEQGSSIVLDDEYEITHDDNGFYFGNQGNAMNVTSVAAILSVALSTGQPVAVS